MLKAALYFRPGPGAASRRRPTSSGESTRGRGLGSARESVEQTCELMDKKRI